MEKVFTLEPKDDWIDVLMWNGLEGGIFGHVHCLLSESRGETKWVPCSDDEEIAIMREYYGEMGCRLPRSNERVGFGEFLEYYEYLGPEIVTINNPVKGHLPGQIRVSQRLIAMLNSLPKKSERVFPTIYQSIENSFLRIRRKAAERLLKPRLSAIQLRSFRHWGGSMIAHYTNGNVLTVKKLLRHKSVTSTMKYITMLDFKDDDEFDVATATTIEEIKQIASAGFQKFDEMKGIHIFRKSKRFNAKH